MKTCTKCGVEKSFDKFGIKRAHSSGHNPRCKGCVSVDRKLHYQDNKDKIIAKTTAYALANKKRISEYQQKYRQRNKQKTAEYMANWQRENALKLRPIKAKYMAAKKQAVPKWLDKTEVDYIYGLASDRGLEVDHIVPLQSDFVCGLHVQDNMRCISKELNTKKGNRYWSDMWGAA